MNRKEVVQGLVDRFGGCGCKDRCEMEQYGDAGRERKPNGSFSVCEIEADELGIPIPKKTTQTR